MRGETVIPVRDSEALRRGPLDDFAGELQAAGCDALQMRVPGFRSVVNLRGQACDLDFRSAVNAVLNVELPTEANRWHGNDERAAIWLGPDEWLVVGADVASGGNAEAMERNIREARPDDPWLSVVDVSHSYACLLLSGPRSRDLLAKGCPLDLQPRVFGPGDCAQSILARTRVLLRALNNNESIEVWVRNSFARYAARWLEDAAAEFREAAFRDRAS